MMLLLSKRARRRILVLMSCVFALIHAEDRYRLGARKAWRMGSNEQRDIKNDKNDWELGDKTQCFSGNELYEMKKVFCDAECIKEEGSSGICNGPWYCSKTEVCQKYKHPDGHRLNDNVPRDCVIVRSCANHSQCFPSIPSAASEGVLFKPDQFDTKSLVQRKGYQVQYGGFTMETTCCRNKDSYKFDRDEPCNSASALLSMNFFFSFVLANTVFFIFYM